MKLQPSRTFALAAFGALALVFFGVAVIVAMFLPILLQEFEPSNAALATLGGIAGGVTMVCGAGAGAMGYRDGRSGGLTSSQASVVLAAQRRQPLVDPGDP